MRTRETILSTSLVKKITHFIKSVYRLMCESDRLLKKMLHLVLRVLQLDHFSSFFSRRYTVKFTVLYKLNTLHLAQFTLENSPGKYKKTSIKKEEQLCVGQIAIAKTVAPTTLSIQLESFTCRWWLPLNLSFSTCGCLQCLRTVDLYILQSIWTFNAKSVLSNMPYVRYFFRFSSTNTSFFLFYFRRYFMHMN